MFMDHGMVTDTVPCEPPPGEEGMDISHEGGEYEAFEGLVQKMADLSGLYGHLFSILYMLIIS
jgi:hypothetical protein